MSAVTEQPTPSSPGESPVYASSSRFAKRRPLALTAFAGIEEGWRQRLAALAPDRASHYFPGTKRSSMQRLTGQKRIGTGAISRIPAASARALLDLKRLVLRRP